MRWLVDGFDSRLIVLFGCCRFVLVVLDARFVQLHVNAGASSKT